MTDYITPIKEQIDENLHEHCLIFQTIGTPNETPRYYNIFNFCEKTKILTIASTQFRWINDEPEGCFFKIDCSGIEAYENVKNKYQSDIRMKKEFWDQFKTYRTEFLKQHYPKINPGY